MFEYLYGTVIDKNVEYATLDVNNVGYKIFVTLNTFQQIKENELQKLYIHSHIREDDYKLFGFYTKKEREFFKVLVNAQGVGPKLAVAILSTYSIEKLSEYISFDDIKSLIKVPGLGIKKAQKLILDIKDKINLNILVPSKEENNSKMSLKRDIELALESLGYKAKDVDKILSKKDLGEYISIEDAIKDILKSIYK